MIKAIEVAVAGLTHDWGKLLQRAERPLTEQASRMREMLCPSRDGRHTHEHVLWTNDALSELGSAIAGAIDTKRITALASHHHRPSEAEDFLVSEADRLASGHDRRDRAETLDSAKRVPLRSAISRLQLEREPAEGGAVYPPVALQADPSLIPIAKLESRSLSPDYARLADELRRAWPGLRDTPAPRLVDVIAHLSERYLTTTPASTIDQTPDVSLHDHSRLVAAIAAALYVYHRETGDFSERSICDRKTMKFLLVSGDLSGIQRYLFDLPEQRKGLARILRARSFYLAMLTHAASLRLLDAARVPTVNRVLDAGGSFQLLLPNAEPIRSALTAAIVELEKWMLRQFHGRLTLNIEPGRPLTGEDFMADRFTRVLHTLQRASETCKRQKLRSQLQSSRDWSEDAARLAYVNAQEALRARADEDVDLGRRLPNAVYVGFWKRAAPRGMLDQPRSILGYEMQLFEQQVDQQAFAAAVDFFAIRDPGAPGPRVPVRVVANYVPRLDESACEWLREHSAQRPSADADADSEIRTNKIATFEHLAALSRRTEDNLRELPRGLDALGCLKADVDRLGMLFGHGCGKDASFGRFAGISRQLDLFFKGFLTHALSKPDSPYRYVYTVFAGGDDLMLIGPWPAIVDLAADLRRWFHSFTGENESVTLSAGVAIAGARIPPSTMAVAAEQRLEAAKDAGRNRVSIFRDVYTWPEYESALEMGRRLETMLTTGRDSGHLSIRPSFAYRLLQYAKMAGKVEAERRTPAAAATTGPARGGVRVAELQKELLWRSHLAYDLDRNIRDRLDKHAPHTVREDLDWLTSTLVTEVTSDTPRLLRLAATYALYRTRGGSHVD